MGNFYTDVIKVSPQFANTNLIKDVMLLEPNMRRKVAAIIADAAGEGHRLIVLETYRSQARQEQLFEQHKTQLKHVGVHGYGLACDLAFLKPDGTVNWDANYSELGALAKNHNVIWGGDWGRPDLPHSFRDNDHIQWCSVNDQTKLFNGSWYPAADGSYNPFEHL